MDRFPFAARRFGDSAEVVLAHLAKPDLCERRRQADGLAEVVDLGDQAARLGGQEQAGKDADGDFFAVKVGVGCIELGQAVVDRMGGCQPRALKAQSAEENVRLDDVIQRRRDDLSSRILAATPYSMSVS